MNDNGNSIVNAVPIAPPSKPNAIDKMTITIFCRGMASIRGMVVVDEGKVVFLKLISHLLGVM